MCRKIERFGNLCASYLYNTKYSDELISNEIGKRFVMFMLKQRWKWLRICILAKEDRDIHRTMIKGLKLKYSIWTGINDNIHRLKRICVVKKNWNREFEHRKEELYESYLNKKLNTNLTFD
eukprot:382827_1